MKSYRRNLTTSQGNACENARKPRCTCRCGGALHGGSHLEFREEMAEAFDAKVMEGSGRLLTGEDVVEIVKRLTKLQQEVLR